MSSSCETMSDKKAAHKGDNWSCEDGSYHGEQQYSLNSLWACWYAALAVLFQVYIVSKNIQRFTSYLSLSWPKNSPTYKELNVYVILTGLGVVMLPLFVVATMMKIGNHSNDGVKIGSKSRKNRHPTIGDECIYANYDEASSLRDGGRTGDRKWSLFRSLWKHGLPVGGLLHVMSAICLLLPRIMMEAQLISHGLLPRADIWKTDMDFLLDHVEDGRVELLSFLDPINETEKQWLQATLAETPVTSQESVVVSTSRRHGFSEKLDLYPGVLSNEMINLFIALIVITVRYPSCFWNRNKSFGLIFSIQQFITSIISLIMISGFTILYKVHILGPDRALLRNPSKLSLDVYQTVILSFGMIFMMLMSSMSLYYYGYQKYTEWVERQKRKKHHLMTGRSKLWGFLPHFLAFICLMLTSMPGLPLMYDLILVYCGSLDSASLIAASAIAFYLLQFILLWLFLTLKITWDFSSTDHLDTEVRSSLLPPPDASLRRTPSRLLAKGDPPLLVIDHGRTIQVREPSTKNAIRAAAQRSRLTQKAVSSLAIPDKSDETAVYWLRPQAMTPSADKKTGDDNACNESKSGSWLRRKRNKSDSQVKRKNSFLRPGKKEDSLEDTFSDDGDYSTMRSLVQREDTDENMREKTFAPAVQSERSMNGDYELLVEQNDQQNRSFNQSSIYNFEDIYGIRSLFNPVESLRVQTARNEYLHSGRVGSLSSDSSASPEKSSDTSSGVHSGSSAGTSIASDKRSASAENLMKTLCQQIHARPSFRSTSLQRHGVFPHPPIQVKCPKLNYSSLGHRYPHQPDSPYTPGSEIPPPMNEINTMVIRRDRNHRPATQEIHCPPSLFTRKTNMRMTSFSESTSSQFGDEDDDYSNHPLPPPPHDLLSSCETSEKPTASIPPQLPHPLTHDVPSPVKQESSFEIEIARHFL